MSKVLVLLVLGCFVVWSAAAFVCEKTEFQCSDGSCIDADKHCNKWNDCGDNSDEKDCGEFKCAKPRFHLCTDNRTCIPAERVCDDVPNCPSGDDELHCGRAAPHGTCDKYEYTCDDLSCIPLDFACDGKRHCPDGSDEVAGCAWAEENCAGFFCANRKCLESHAWVCDGVDDCGDGSDEVGCVRDCKVEFKKFLCKDNDTCISYDKVCDGTSDCADNSDENGLCKSSTLNCATKKCPTGSQCLQSPSGGVCICPPGFASKNNVCANINECETFGTCSQGCTDSLGSYICTCAEKFTLKPDGKSCEVKYGEAILLYTTQKSIVGVYLTSRFVYTIADKLSQAIGVAFDGEHVYWTTIQAESESIVKARPDGSKQEWLVTSGLDAPEDLTIDWLTGNIYFTDNMQRHIAACTNNGRVCTVLVTIGVDQPRGIALHPKQGVMFWSDWGSQPMIGTANMDGSDSRPLVSENIRWPNGVTLDIPNKRVYWTDGRLARIESVKFDGSDRHVVLTDILKHPYGLAVFEDSLYWSDWGTRSVHKCHKFTGKQHEVIAKDSNVYAVHVFHSALQPKIPNPCSNSPCSHMCLLAGNGSYTCACPDGMSLGSSQHKCFKSIKKQRLFMGYKNYILEMEHPAFGRHTISNEYALPYNIDALEFNSVNGTLFAASNSNRKIYEYNLNTRTRKVLVEKNVEKVAAMSFDYLAHNLYWADSERHTIEVLSLRNNQRAIVRFFSGLDSPIAMSVVPSVGKIFVALQSPGHVHIDQIDMHGLGDHHHTFEQELGSDGIEMLVDPESNILYWSDSKNNRIEYTVIGGSTRLRLRSGLKDPVAMALVDDEIYWSSKNSPMLYWVHKSNLGTIKSTQVKGPTGSSYSTVPRKILLQSSSVAPVSSHKCMVNNGGCSHICISMGKSDSACLCPPSMEFKDVSNRTCIESVDCEFRCKSGECLTASRHCNGRTDCADGSDEENCDESTKRAKVCARDEFACHSGDECLTMDKRCDKNYDCDDKSDEEGCENFDHLKKCHTHQHSCNNGRCVDLTALCDGIDDCGDDSDESDCAGSLDSILCGRDMFRCGKQCVPRSWECDGKLDCMDGSDEHDGCASLKCPENFRSCKQGACIDATLFCDGNDDCGDGSDESDCSPTSSDRQILCGDELDGSGERTKFQCASQPTLCLDMSARCNGTAECPRGEDEVNCSGCSLYQFQCATSLECIVIDWRCDGQKDCRDGSDEKDCGSVHSPDSHGHVAMACVDGLFDCQDGSCVEESRVCDGSNDCANGRDESNMCLTACAKNPCQHSCKATPFGAVCSCREGYKLNDDKLTCQDVDECDELNPCAQICQNTVGSYRCSCFADFMLRPDKTSCKSIESNHSVLFSTFNEIRQLHSNPLTLSVLVSANESRISALDVNVGKGRVYFTTGDSGSIFEFDMRNKRVTKELPAGSEGRIAVDWRTGNIYSVSRVESLYIQVCNMQRGCAKIIKLLPTEVVKAIAVDSVNGKLFCSTVVHENFEPPKSNIYVSGLDGSKRKVLLSKVGYVVALEADVYKQALVFVDRHTKTIQAINYDKEKSSVKYIARKENAITNPSDLSIYENEAFIVNMGSKEAVRCRLYGDMKCQSFALNVYNAENIVVVAPTRQKTVPNVCEGHKCSVICVPAEAGPKCLCRDGSTMPEGIDCPADATLEAHLAANSAHVDTNNESTAMSAGAVTAICVVVILAILFTVLGYIFYKRKTETGHRKFNLHFQNPLSSKSAGGEAGSPGGFPSRKIELPRPLQRFFSDSSRTEILLETKKKPTEFQPVRFSARQACILLEDSSDNDSSRGVGNFEDERAQLVF